MTAKIFLTDQEIEFAIAARDFTAERRAEAGTRISIDGGVLTVPDDYDVRKAFLDFGVARVFKVFQLAIDNKAIAPERVPRLITDLARFNEKIVTTLVPMDDGRPH